MFSVSPAGIISVGTGTITFDGTNIPNSTTSSNGLVISSGGFGTLTLDSANDVVALGVRDVLLFEGSTDDGFETILEAADPTVDRMIVLPDADGTIVLDSAAQDLVNKTINGLTLEADTDGFTISGGTTPRTLSVTGGDKTLSGSGTTIDLGGDLTLGGSFTTSGANSLTFTTNGTTGLTLPTTGTLATLTGEETLSNKTLTDSTLQGEKIDVRFADIGNADITLGTIQRVKAKAVISQSSVITEMVARTLAMENPRGSETAILINSGWNRGLRIVDANTYSIQLESLDQDPASGITFGIDTNLYRSAPDLLKTDDALIVGGSLSVFGSEVLTTSPTVTIAGSVSIETANGEAGITFGGDTTLFRSAARTLTTGDTFTVGASLRVLGWSPVDRSRLDCHRELGPRDSQRDAGITFGGDTTLFRSAARTFTTGDTFTVGASLRVLGGGVLSTEAVLTVIGSLDLGIAKGDAGITFGGDTTLFRSAVRTLTTGDTFIVGGSLRVLGGGVLSTEPTLTVIGSLDLGIAGGDAGITFGGDTTLFRSAVCTLTTGDTFIVGGSLRVLGGGVLSTEPTLTVIGSLDLGIAGGDAGITFGGDTTLFWSAAHTLTTGDTFIVGGSLRVLGGGVLSTEPTLTVIGSLDLGIAGGDAGITFGGDTTLFRSAAHTLTTGDTFIVGGSLRVLGGGVLSTEPTLTVIGSLDLGIARGDAGITFGGDTTLFRSAAHTLTTGDTFIVGGSLRVLGGGVLSTQPTLTVIGSLNIETASNEAGITFGGDTTLFRDAANDLKTGQDFIVGENLTVGRALTVSGGVGLPDTSATLTVTGSLDIGLANSEAGITFGGDTTLFRDDTRTLKTGDTFIVGGSLRVLGGNVLSTVPTLTITGSLSIETASDEAGITFGGDTTLFRDAVGDLKTGQDFIVGENLTVGRALTVSGGVGLPNTSATLTVTGSLDVGLANSEAGITFGGDTTLFRDDARTLKTGDTFIVGGSLRVLGGNVLSTVPTLTITGSLSIETASDEAGITFGGDTTLFRDAAGDLKTGQDFIVGENLTVGRALTVSGGVGLPNTAATLTVTGSIDINLVNGEAGITFGGDTTLFRSAASALQTGQDFIVGGSLVVGGAGVATTSATLTVTGSLDIRVANGEAGITFGGDTTLFRSKPNQLKTGQDFIVGGSLTVGGAGVGTTVATLTITGSLDIALANGERESPLEATLRCSGRREPRYRRARTL